MQDNRMVLEIASVPGNAGLARVAVATLAAGLGFTVAELEEIKVAVSEAVSNAIVHGYDSDPQRTVRVEATVAGGVLRVVVADQGRGIADLAQAREPAFSSDPERMGLGFMFMEQFMDGVRVDSAPGQGTVVTMVRSPQPGGRAPSAAAG